MSTNTTWRTESSSQMQFRLRTVLLYLSLLSFVLAILARGGPTIVVALLFPFVWTWGWMRIGLGVCSFCVVTTSRVIDYLSGRHSGASDEGASSGDLP